MSDYFDRIERQLVRNVEAGLPRSSRFPIRLEHLAPIAALLVVAVVAGGCSSVLAAAAKPGRRPTGTGSGSCSQRRRSILDRPRARRSIARSESCGFV
jgi:hypothetical protein